MLVCSPSFRFLRAHPTALAAVSFGPLRHCCPDFSELDRASTIVDPRRRPTMSPRHEHDFAERGGPPAPPGSHSWKAPLRCRPAGHRPAIGTDTTFEDYCCRGLCRAPLRHQRFFMQQCFDFLPLPHGHGEFRPTEAASGSFVMRCGLLERPDSSWYSTCDEHPPLRHARISGAGSK